MKPILLDTHAALWAIDGKLNRALVKEIDAAADRSELLLSPITAWEIGMLVQRKRLALTLSANDYIRVLFARPGVIVAALTPTIAASAALLAAPAPANPADRFLIATAAAYGAQFVTHDKEIRGYAKSTGYLRCIPC
jgi:PIN domain nuclease of toxin-antitoxin system